MKQMKKGETGHKSAGIGPLPDHKEEFSKCVVETLERAGGTGFQVKHETMGEGVGSYHPVIKTPGLTCQ